MIHEVILHLQAEEAQAREREKREQHKDHGIESGQQLSDWAKTLKLTCNRDNAGCHHQRKIGRLKVPNVIFIDDDE